MRIGIFLGNLSPNWGGAFTFEKSILEALLKTDPRGHEFFLFFYGTPPETQAPPHVKFIQLKANPWVSNTKSFVGRVKNRLGKMILPPSIRLELDQIKNEIDDLNFKRNSKNSLNAALIENKMDLIWFPSLGIPPVEIPFLVTLWDLGHRQLQVFPEMSISGATWAEREKAYLAYLKKACKIFIGTESAKKELSFLYGINPELIRVVPLPVPDYLTQVQGKNRPAFDHQNEPFLFYPAQFWPHKNHITCLLALKILKEKYGQTFHLVLTGSDKGNQGFIQQKVKELKLEKQVHFLGFVDSESLVWLYKNAYALVFPTFLGPDNIPPLEAMAFGCPVIASDIAGASEQMLDAAILIDPRREDLFAEAIAHLSPEKKQSLIRKGQELVRHRTALHYLQTVLDSVQELEPYRRCWSNSELWKHL